MNEFNMRFTFLIAVLLICQFGTCQTKEIYTNSDFANLSKDHKILSVLPFKAIVKLRPKQMQSMSPEEITRLQHDEGMAVQSALESYFLKHQQETNISFQPIMTTNALLGRNNINENNIDNYTPQELCDLFEVDGLISGILSTEKPMSEGASLALGLLVGFYGATNSGKCTINTYDGKTGELLWKYEKTLSRSLGSSTSQVVNAMMRKASRKFPYAK